MDESFSYQSYLLNHSWLMFLYAVISHLHQYWGLSYSRNWGSHSPTIISGNPPWFSHIFCLLPLAEPVLLADIDRIESTLIRFQRQHVVSASNLAPGGHPQARNISEQYLSISNSDDLPMDLPPKELSLPRPLPLSLSLCLSVSLSLTLSLSVIFGTHSCCASPTASMMLGPVRWDTTRKQILRQQDSRNLEWICKKIRKRRLIPKAPASHLQPRKGTLYELLHFLDWE